MRFSISHVTALFGIISIFLVLGIGPCEDPDVTPTPSPLQWYTTCGDPVCGGYTPPQEVPACDGQQEGDACADDGSMCDPKSECNVLLICAAEDPKSQGCPISQRSAKKDIVYLNQTQLQATHDRLLKTRLATFQYQEGEEPIGSHLGFIIEDDPGSPAVMASGKRVDLYGFTSMTAAAVQVQQQEIEGLKQTVASLKRALEDVQSEPRCP